MNNDETPLVPLRNQYHVINIGWIKAVCSTIVALASVGGIMFTLLLVFIFARCDERYALLAETEAQFRAINLSVEQCKVELGDLRGEKRSLKESIDRMSIEISENRHDIKNLMRHSNEK